MLDSNGSKVAAIVGIIVVGLFIRGCDASEAADNFTGEVTVERTFNANKDCMATIVMEDDQKDEVEITGWGICYIESGSKIKLVDGKYVR